MRAHAPTAALLAAALALAAPARAVPPLPPGSPGAPDAPVTRDPAPEAPRAWGLHSGDTVARGDILLYGEVGFPDLVIGFQRGVTDAFDVGFRASAGWGVDYIVPKGRRTRGNVNDFALGVGLTVPLRFTVVRSDRVSVLLHADPGVKFDYLDAEPRTGPPYAGPQLPVGVDLGVHLGPRSTLTLGLDIPFVFRVTPDPTVLVPFLAGLTFEQRFSERFGMSFNLRPGVVWGVNRTGSASDLALLGQIGFLGRL